MGYTKFPELGEIAKLRQEAGMSQSSLANMVKIPQSYLSKIESGKANPGYRLVKALFAAIEGASIAERTETIGGLASRIEAMSPDSSVLSANRIMRKMNFSQLPVFDSGKNVGRLTEAEILAAKRKYGHKEPLSKTVREIMGPAYPEFDADTPKSEAGYVVEKLGAILIKKKDKLIGIITRYDLLI